jgi:hypothetical protein
MVGINRRQHKCAPFIRRGPFDTEIAPHRNAPPAHQGETAVDEDLPEVLENIGGGGWTRTNDLRIMSLSSRADSKDLQQDSSAEHGKVLQNPQLPRNRKGDAVGEEGKP